MNTIPPKNTRSSVQGPALMLGGAAVIAQVLLMREMMAVTRGHEIGYALILTAWMLWAAAGSWLFSRLAPRRVMLAPFMMLTGMLLPLTLIGCRYLRVLWGASVGETLSILSMAGMAAVMCAPLALSHGALFARFCREGVSGPEGPAEIYLWESLGWAVGGLVLTLMLIPHVSPLVIAVMTALVVAGTAFKTAFHRPAGRAIFVGAILLAGFLFTGAAGRVDTLTLRQSWRPLRVVAEQDSPYGRLTVTEAGGEYSLYENGVWSFSTGHREGMEEGIHYPLLQHPRPRRVLLVGGGLGGGLREALKYPEVRVDAVEPDPAVIPLVKTVFPLETLRPLTDPRARLFFTDARRFVKTTTERYDAVMVNVGDPQTALLNRYFTVDFFREVRRILQPGGIFSLRVTSSENYLSPQTKTFLRTLNASLQTVFARTASIPGENHIFLATEDGTLTLDPQALAERLRTSGVETQYVRDYYFSSKLSLDRQRMTAEVLAVPGRLNTDRRPVGYLYGMTLWSAHAQTWFQDAMHWLSQIPEIWLVILPLGLVMAGGFVRRRSTALLAGIGVTGATGIVLQMMLIFMFQILYGHLYDKVALLVGAYMAGLALGGWTARRQIAAQGDLGIAYRRAQAGLVVYPLLLPLMWTGFSGSAGTAWEGVMLGVFFCLPLTAGFLSGMQYPLAVRLRSLSGDDARQAGGLYAADLLGAAVAGLVTAVLLFPLFGLDLVYVCAGLNAAVLWMLIRVEDQPASPSLER